MSYLQDVYKCSGVYILGFKGKFLFVHYTNGLLRVGSREHSPVVKALACNTEGPGLIPQMDSICQNHF